LEKSKGPKSKTTLSVQIHVDGFVAMTGGQLLAGPKKITGPPAAYSSIGSCRTAGGKGGVEKLVGALTSGGEQKRWSDFGAWRKTTATGSGLHGRRCSGGLEARVRHEIE
jgi:hypothetical protein